MIKNALTYEIMTPQSVGVPTTRLVLGKHSGRHALGLRCEELGHKFDRRELDGVYRQFVLLADKIKTVEDRHLLELIEKTHGRPLSSQEKSVEAPYASKVGGHNGDGQSPIPPLPAAHPPIGDASGRGAAAQYLSEHDEQEDYLCGV